MADQVEPTKHRLIELRGSNVKRLRAFVIRPKRTGMTVIGGKNGAGKTSVIDTVQMLLGGSKAIPLEPVRHGARKADMYANLEGIEVERVITAKGTELVVKNAEGVPQRSPQELLDVLTGGRDSLSFDPVEFGRMKDTTKQGRILRDVMGLGTEFEKLDDKRAVAYAQRTDANKEVKRLEAVLDSTEEFPNAPKKPIDVKETAALLQAAHEDNASREKKFARIEADRRQLEQQREAIASMEEHIAELQQKIGTARVEEELALAGILLAEKELPSMTPTADLQEKLQNAETINSQIRANETRLEQEAKLRKQEKLSEDCTETINAIDEQKAQLLTAANFPVPGLAFDEMGPTLNGVPLIQASGAEKIRIGVAVAAAMNLPLRLVLIRDGSLLDDDSMALLEELLEKHDLQALVERVGTDDPNCVVIEDGLVVSPSGEVAAE